MTDRLEDWTRLQEQTILMAAEAIPVIKEHIESARHMFVSTVYGIMGAEDSAEFRENYEQMKTMFANLYYKVMKMSNPALTMMYRDNADRYINLYESLMRD